MVEARLLGREASLAALADFSFGNYKFSADEQNAWSDIRELLGKRPADAVVVALGDDDDSLYAAVQFRSCLDQLDQLATPVFVRLKQQHKLAAFLRQFESHPLLPNRLVPFGSMQLLTSPEILLGRELDRLARAGHEVYASSTGQGERSPASVSWEHLAERFKASNRAQADHMATALNAVGYRIVPGVTKTELSHQDLERLAEIEHWRWCVERRSAGWKYAEMRDDVLKTNPILKDWRELSDADRDWNRELARRIPEALEREHLGLIKERELTPDSVSAKQLLDNELPILRIDPLNERDLISADAACENPSTRIRLVWKGAGRLAEIEHRLAHHPKLSNAIECWTRT
jgi:hypothetical protein